MKKRKIKSACPGFEGYNPPFKPVSRKSSNLVADPLLLYVFSSSASLQRIMDSSTSNMYGLICGEYSFKW